MLGLQRKNGAACLPPACKGKRRARLFALPKVVQREHALLWRPRLEAARAAKRAAC